MAITVSSISNPEFINLQPCDVNPLMSACEIKVLYVGQNRNHTFISKDVAAEMSKTLRGAPIVGWFKEDKDDFGDHGERITIDGDGVKFDCMTKPYGFVSPDARVWFQKFTEQDDFGEEVEREYLMTTGYLWTGQFEECKDVVDSGRPHSMELDNETLKGKWAVQNNTNMEFFIINDAIFSKLCILGEDVEPCFEGSTITAPEVSKNFTLDNDFKQTLYSMMQDLKFALKGEAPMNNENMDNTQVVETPEAGAENFSATQDNVDKNTTVENQNSTEVVNDAETSFEKKKEDDAKDDNNSEDNKDTGSDDSGDDSSKEDEKDDEDKKKYALLEQKYQELEQNYTALQTQYQSLVDFKNKVEGEKKDDMIKGFYMLSDEDKKDVIENKDKYTLDEIEAKLSIIYTKKKMASEEQHESHEETVPGVAVTYNLDNDESNLPDWVKAVRETEKEMNV